MELSQKILNLCSAPYGLYPEYVNVRVPAEVTPAPEKLAEGGYETKLLPSWTFRTQPDNGHLLVRPLKRELSATVVSPMYLAAVNDA